MLPWPALDADASQAMLRGAVPAVGVTVKEATGSSRIMATSVRSVLAATGTGDGVAEGVVPVTIGIVWIVAAGIKGVWSSWEVAEGGGCTCPVMGCRNAVPDGRVRTTCPLRETWRFRPGSRRV